jgi:Flp pilus assembly protein TadG
MMRNERGNVLLETAIVLPIVLVILFGIIEFGILLYDRAMLTNASREGARAGIVYDYDDGGTADDPDDDRHHPEESTIVATVQNYCADYLISFVAGSTLTVAVDGVGGASGDPLTVTVNYPFRFLAFSNLIGLIGGDLENLVNLRAVTVMRLE